MKPFDIQKARDGAEVCTRDGRKARIICFDANNTRPIIALVEEDYGIEFAEGYCKDGHCFNSEINTPNDLMLAAEKKTAWVNVYRDDLGHNLFSLAHKDRESAEKFKYIWPWTYITTTKIEWEE